MPRLPLPDDWRTRVLVAASALAVGKCEVGANAGAVPEYCQRATGNRPPDFWCMSAASRIYERALRHRSPLLLTGSCEQQRTRAAAKGALRTRAQFDEARQATGAAVAGWLFLCVATVNGEPHAHHTGIVGVLSDDGVPVTRGPRGGFLVIEGNAADPEKPSSRNGDGLYAGRERGHPDDTTVYAFIDPTGYPL